MRKLHIIYGNTSDNHNKKSLMILLILVMAYTLCCCTHTTFIETTAASPDTTAPENIMINSIQNNTHHQNLLALYNANLIDGNNDQVRPQTTVIINDSRIIDIIDNNDTNIIAKHSFYKNHLNATLIDLSEIGRAHV